jgi:hypothetical protein
MANTLTTVSETMVMDEVMPALKNALLPLNAFSVNYAQEQLYVGKSVKVNVVSAKSAGAFSSTFETGDTTVTGTDVTITAPRFSSWYVDPKLEAIPTAARWLAEGREAAYAVGKDVLQLGLAKFVTANIGNADGTDKLTVTAANYDATDLADQWKLIKTKKVTGRLSAIHNIEYASALMKDAALTDKSASGSDMILTGELPQFVRGMRTFYTDAFPTALTNENTGVVVTGSETVACAIGAGMVPLAGLEQAAGVREFVVTDPDTGLSFLWRQWVNSATGVYWGTVYVFTGFSFLRNSASRILSA